MIGFLWTARTLNDKTGDVPTMIVGEDYEQTHASCEGCPLIDKVCYSHNGTPRMGTASVHKAHARGSKNYSFKGALHSRSVRANYVRVSSIGDAVRGDPVVLRAQHDEVRAENLGWLAYTHFPQEAIDKGVSDLFCASVEHEDVARDGETRDVLASVDHWLAEGFSRVAAAMPYDCEDTITTPGGKVGRWCPAQRTKNKVQCNDCGWCDPRHAGPDWVIFKDHGPQARAKLRSEVK